MIGKTLMNTLPDTEINEPPGVGMPGAGRTEKHKGVLKWTSGAMLAIAVGLSVFLWPTRSRARTGAPTVELPVVAAAKVERQEIARELVFYSELRPYQEVDLHAKVAGYVDAIEVD